MTDLQQLLTTLTFLGIEFESQLYDEENNPYNSEDFTSPVKHVIQIGSGVGYAFMCHEFYFDEKGKFVDHGAWEWYTR